jgi:hypothetical protein
MPGSLGKVMTAVAVSGVRALGAPVRPFAKNVPSRANEDGNSEAAFCRAPSCAEAATVALDEAELAEPAALVALVAA